MLKSSGFRFLTHKDYLLFYRYERAEGRVYIMGTEILRMNYLLTDAIVKNNDQVVTTGSTVYPKGLILGYVEDAGFDETGVAKYAMLRPAADLEDLEQVFVITDYVSE